MKPVTGTSQIAPSALASRDSDHTNDMHHALYTGTVTDTTETAQPREASERRQRSDAVDVKGQRERLAAQLLQALAVVRHER